MNAEQERVARECSALSAAGRINFGEVVGRLMAADIERYHADYSRRENTFYTPGGGSCVVAMDLPDLHFEHAFDAARIEAAVRAAQSGEVKYKEFSSRATAAGCVGYFVVISGKRVQYFGRRGEVHTEWFPGAAPATDR
jgi:uncharacterized protein YbcV (DUF1398 family)